MDGETLVVTCKVADYNAATGVCAAPFYSAPQSSIPALSIDDANAIGGAMALLIGSAWLFKKLRLAVEQIG